MVFFTDSWRDDATMSVMLNTFRPRQVNPEHYDHKMNFWKEMIENYCDFKGNSSFTIHELKEVFKRNETVPYCLQDVLNEMSAEGNVVSKAEFMAQPKSLAGWAVDSLVVRPMSWGFGKLKQSLFGGGDDEHTEFISKSAVASQSRELQEHVRNRHSYDNIISMDDLMAAADDIDSTTRDGILLALQHLNNEKKVYIEENKSNADASPNHHKLLLKFSKPHQTVEPITEMERSIYNLEQTEKFLMLTVEKKEHQLNELLAVVKGCLKDGKKQLAKTHLRKKHRLEEDISKSISILDNVQTMLQRVHSSNSDKEIVNTYKMGSAAIKEAFAENGINIENVHDIIEDMQEIFEDQEQYEAAISEPMRGTKGIDDSDLEKELAELMNAHEPADKNQNTNNAGGSPQDAKLLDEMTSLDRELELRLQRLRADSTAQDKPLPATPQKKMHHAGLTPL